VIVAYGDAVQLGAFTKTIQEKGGKIVMIPALEVEAKPRATRQE
jgi:hypothetical protein